MTKMLAVAARELRERWLLLPGGLALGSAWLLLPVFGLPRDEAPPVGLLSAVLLGGLAAMLAGATMVVRDAADGRLAFLFGKPLSWPCIWGGKWIAALLLSGATGLGASLPWMAVYPPLTAGASWWSTMADAQGWAFAVSLVVLIVGFSNFGASALRSRSAWLIVDFTLLLTAVWAVRRVVVPLAILGILGILDLGGGWGQALVPMPLALALLVGSASQLAVGRTDLRRAHRALSVTFWAFVFALLAAMAGWLTWVERATPADIRTPYLVLSAPDGRWVYVEGTTNRGGSYNPDLLVDSASGRYLRTFALDKVAWHRMLRWGGFLAQGGGFSANGRFTVKWREAGAATRLTLVDLQATPPLTTQVTLEASAPPNSLTAVCLSGSAETALVVQDGSTSLVALPEGRLLASSTLPPGWRVAAARLLDAKVARLWLARGEWGAATPVHGPAEILIVELLANASPKTLTVPMEVPLSPTKDEIVADSSGERLLTLDRGLSLRNGADGAVVTRLLDGEKVAAARFLADGRIVALSLEGNRRVLRTFGADGSLAKRVELDLGLRPFAVSLGPEVRPGQIVIATGTPFPASDSLIVDVPDGRVVERLEGLRPAPTRPWAGDVQARPAARATLPPGYFVSSSGQVVRIDFATGERRIVTGPGAAKGERLKGL